MAAKANFSAGDFDPYKEWLNIPLGCRPPTIYQLLDINPKERDVETIRYAAKARQEIVRRHLDGPRKASAQSLLYELEEARVILLNPDARRKYDARIDLLYKQQHAHARTHGLSLESGGKRPVGEESGLARRLTFIVSVLAVAFGLMAAWSYRDEFSRSGSTDWGSPPNSSHQDGVQTRNQAASPEPMKAPQDSVAPVLAVAPFDARGARNLQEAAAKLLNQPLELKNSIDTSLVLIPAGEFQMGSNEDVETLLNLLPKSHRQDEPATKLARAWIRTQQPAHKVRITRPFYIGKFETTQAQWRALMGSEPWKPTPNFREGADYPMPFNWETANEFCRKLSQKEGHTYRLPTEAEWEYACRAGTTTRYSFGDAENLITEYGWTDLSQTDFKAETHPVGQKRPNPFGLHDMHGNARELCSDLLNARYYRNSPAEDPQGAANSGLDPPWHVLRGGSAHFYSDWSRSSNRDHLPPKQFAGVRLVREIKTP